MRAVLKFGFLVTLVLVLGCGRIQFQSVDASDADTVDSSSDAVVPVDPTLPFSNITLMPGVRLVGDDPTLTGDMLEIIYEGTDRDLFVSRRASVDDGWGPPEPIAELNSPQWESTPEMTYDGLTIYVASDRSGQRLIFRSTRASRAEPWSPPSVVTELQSAGIIDGTCAAVPLATGGDLLMVGKDESGRGHELRLFERVGAAWSFVRLLDEVNSAAAEAGSFLAGPDVLYFHSNRLGSGMETIFRAVRPAGATQFEAPEQLLEFDLPQRQLDPWVSPDARTIVIVSEHDGNGLGFFQATR